MGASHAPGRCTCLALFTVEGPWDEQVQPAGRLSHDPLEPGRARGQPGRAEARAALAELCTAYWYPIYAFIRRKGHDPEEALDLTQDYFTRLLESGVLASADHRLGRFRAFLRTDCGFFLSHHHERRRAIKRGGGQTALAIDARDAEGRYLREPTDAATPDRLFDRAWAVSLLDEVLKQLAHEYADTGRDTQFKVLQGAIGKQARQVSYEDLAARLGTSAGGGPAGRAAAPQAIQGYSPRPDRRDTRRPRRGRDQSRDP